MLSFKLAHGLARVVKEEPKKSTGRIVGVLAVKRRIDEIDRSVKAVTSSGSRR